MKYLILLSLVFISAIASAKNFWSASYQLESDTCFQSQNPTLCDPQYRTKIHEMDLNWSVGSNPMAGSLFVTPKVQTPSLYADELTPVGYFSNDGLAGSNLQVYVYEEYAWVSTPVYATPGYCKIQIRFLPRAERLTVRFVGIPDQQCETGEYTELLRETVFQKK